MLLKREDQNPTGSHKDRAAEAQVRACREAGDGAVVLSSSGNAAIASARAGRLQGLNVYAFLSERTPASKVQAVLDHGATVLLGKKPKNLATFISRGFKLSNLRPSACDISIEGFRSLGRELVQRWETHRDFDSVFQFSSSGSSLIAVGLELARTFPAPSLHAVQAGAVCPIAAPDDEAARLGAAPTTGALCASKTPRSADARRLLAALGGRGWIMTDAEVDAAGAELEQSGRAVAREAAAALAAADRAIRTGAVTRPLVVLTGKAPAVTSPWRGEHPRLHRISDHKTARQFFLEEQAGGRLERRRPGDEPGAGAGSWRRSA